MSDNLKKFIQESKSKFDLESPRPDLFDKIMKDIDCKPKANQVNPFSNTRFKWLAVAATLALLIVSTFYFYPTNDLVKSPTQQLTTIRIQENNIEEKISSPDPAILNNPFQNTEHSTIKNEIPKQTKLAIQQQEKPINLTENAEEKNPQKEHVIANITVDTIYNNELPTRNSEPIAVSQNPEPVSENIIPSQGIQKVISHPETSTASISTSDTLLEKPTTSLQEQSKIVNSEISNTESIEEQESDQNSSITKTIKKGFFKFLSKKAKKWSGNTLTIRNVETEDQSILALRYKNERVEFSKSFNLRSKE